MKNKQHKRQTKKDPTSFLWLSIAFSFDLVEVGVDVY